MDWLKQAIRQPDQHFYQRALQKQAQLTKPPGSLGQLEQIAARLAAMQNSEQPCVQRVWVSVFAADHGVAEESVSAFPQSVTTEMVRNFASGGAAVNVLSRFVQADFEVVDVGLLKPLAIPGVVERRAGKGTANIMRQPAMTENQMSVALQAGKDAVDRAMQTDVQLFIGGEMGIANTCSATAIAVAQTGLTVEQLTGAGTGLNEQGVAHKLQVIKHVLGLHQQCINSPLKALQYFGGFEIAALLGAYLAAAQNGLTILVDGFISSVAALLAVNINPAIREWLFYAHCSHEKGHRLLLEYLQVRALLDLNMRLGEASGALAAVPLLQMACKLHNEMATFESAGVSTD